MELLLVSVASFFAGFVDSIVGGGGLILVPALFAVFPNAPPATLFGVNKSASIWGTGVAAWQYAQRVKMPWHALWPAALVCFAGSMAGAWTVTQISPDFLRRLLPLILLGVLIYNTTSNLAALLLFAAKGHVWWHLALAMAVANVVGSLIGTRLALKHGSGFVRVAFILVVSVLILKTGADAWL